MLQGGVRGQDRVVGLNDNRGDLRGRVHGELELGLLPVLGRETLHQKGAKPGTSTTTKGVEHQEALKTTAVISKLADTIEGVINELLANGIVTTSIIVGGILLTTDQLLRVEEMLVGSSTDLINDTRLQVDKDGTGNVLAIADLGEEGGEGTIRVGIVAGLETIRLDTVLLAVEFPAGITNLDTGLTDMDRDDLTHD